MQGTFSELPVSVVQRLSGYGPLGPAGTRGIDRAGYRVDDLECHLLVREILRILDGLHHQEQPDPARPTSSGPPSPPHSGRSDHHAGSSGLGLPARAHSDGQGHREHPHPRLGHHGGQVVQWTRDERFDQIGQHSTGGGRNIGVAGQHRHDAYRQPGQADDRYRPSPPRPNWPGTSSRESERVVQV